MPSISLKLIVGTQWMLVMWATIWGSLGGSIYNWTNVTVLAIGVWAIADKQSVDAVFMYMIFLVISIIIDIVVLSVFFPIYDHSGIMRFSVGMAILNLILKPFVILLLYQMYKDRGGEYNINFGQNATSYDNIGPDNEKEHAGSTANFNPPLISKN